MKNTKYIKLKHFQSVGQIKVMNFKRKIMQKQSFFKKLFIILVGVFQQVCLHKVDFFYLFVQTGLRAGIPNRVALIAIICVISSISTIYCIFAMSAPSHILF